MATKKDVFGELWLAWRVIYICFLVVAIVHVYSRIGEGESGGGEAPVIVEPPAEVASPAVMVEPEIQAETFASVKAPEPVAVDEPKPIPKVEPKPVVKPAPVAKPPVDSVDPVSGFHASEPTVIMLSTPGCAPCKMWDAAKAPLLAKEKVKYFSVDDVPQPSYPAFRIYDGKGRWHGKTGSRTTIAEIMALIKG